MDGTPDSSEVRAGRAWSRCAADCGGGGGGRRPVGGSGADHDKRRPRPGPTLAPSGTGAGRGIHSGVGRDRHPVVRQPVDLPVREVSVLSRQRLVDCQRPASRPRGDPTWMPESSASSFEPTGRRAPRPWRSTGRDRGSCASPFPRGCSLTSHPVPGAPDGRTTFEDLGCPNCHGSGSQSVRGRTGPVLTSLGSRVKPAWIRNWLDAPEEFRLWSTMPEMLSAAERADVAAFLSVQTGESVDEPSVRKSHVERGRTSFQSVGCGACHGSDLPLTGLGSKTTVGQLQRYLLDPIRYSPDSRMPSFHLSESEALDLAAYLADSRNEGFERPSPPGDPLRGGQIVESSGCLGHATRSTASLSRARPRPWKSWTRGRAASPTPCRRGFLGTGSAMRSAKHSRVSWPSTGWCPTQLRPQPSICLEDSSSYGATRATGSAATIRQARWRSPPRPLTGVGDKLRAEWIERVLSSQTRTLDWQELRMPSYGAARAAWLSDALAKTAGVHPSADAAPTRNGSSEAGRDRLGVDGSSGGLGCIGCHGWGEFPSLGENGPNLVEAGKRLRQPWFERWMRDPPRILPGTSMPNYFGGTASPLVLSVVSDLWAAFRAAPGLPPPYGFETAEALPGDEAMPMPTDRAVVVRWDMPEASPAAVAVGLPGGISYCFDAGESRLRYAWRGGFIDLSRTLLSKKNRETNLTETAKIVGEIFFREGASPIRSADRERIPQRRFRGYRLVDSMPEFHYEVDGVSVRERIVPVERGFKRYFRLDGVEQPMWFVAAEAEGVEIRSTLADDEIPTGESVAFEVTVAWK